MEEAPLISGSYFRDRWMDTTIYRYRYRYTYRYISNCTTALHGITAEQTLIDWAGTDGFALNCTVIYFQLNPTSESDWSKLDLWHFL